MYKIYLDGDLMFDTARLDDEAYTLLNPHLTRKEGDGSLTFTMPPGNRKYNSIKKKKSIVTVYLDDVLIFRGRVTESESDTFNQKDVYCEGDLSFLKDSQWPEGATTGTVQDFFRAIIANHNSQVESDKRFTVGVISAVDANKMVQVGDGSETRKYWNASKMILDKLMESYGGKVRTRTVGDVTYIDWLDAYEEENTQGIRFAVNLLDLKNREDAGDVFTVLIPQGYSEIQDDGTYSDPVDITSVNNGLNYIEDAAGIAKHGRIWKVHTWAATKDPAELKAKAEAFMSVGMELRSLTLKAVDMYFIDGSIDMIEPYKKVHILSQPHGVDLNIACVKIDTPLMEPENTSYTFGEPPETLTESAERTEKEVSEMTGGGSGGGGGGRKTIQEEAQEILRWARIRVDEANAHISQNTGEINNLTGELTQVGIEMDGLSANMLLYAKAVDLEGLETQVYIELDAKQDQINLKANKFYVDAEITAVKTLIAEEIEVSIADIERAYSERVVTNGLAVNGPALIDTLHLGGNSVSKTTIPIVTSFTQALGEASTATNYTLLTVA